ncbi:MAG: SDR family NAD(P)-dependent oxidoreductase [Bacteroidales bacterium]|nr:SDR family NAD(P)-dependent oxidoreductase [Bacteroidales bacterium]
MKVIIITGASSGIGYMSARDLARAGHKVYGAARRIEKMEPLREFGVVPLKLDVTDEGSVLQAVETVMAEQGRIDVLVNNAGFGMMGPIETVSMEDARNQMDVNLFGMAAMTRAVLPHMRSQGEGRIINTSSMAGSVPIPYGAWYNISKYSVEAFSADLRMEVRPFGIKVSVIAPGPIRTQWGTIAADHLQRTTEGTVYEENAVHEAEAFRYAYTSSLLPGPEKVASCICKAALSPRPRFHYRPGPSASVSIIAHRLMPSSWWDAMVCMMWRWRGDRWPFRKQGRSK